MITVNLYYKGTNGNARAFVEEMESSGIAESIQRKKKQEMPFKVIKTWRVLRICRWSVLKYMNMN